MHIDINYWLDQLNLPQYQPLFHRYVGVQEILHLDEAAIKDEIGIKNSAHRAKIVSSLVLLRAKSNLRIRQQQQQQALGNSKTDTTRMARSRTEFTAAAATHSQFGKSQHQQLHQYSASVLDLSRMNYEVVGVVETTEAESLRRQLEWELSLDGRRLESHAWYHGPIPRAHAESLLADDGQFLVRDSSSGQADDLVLSTRFRGVHLHFIISKVVVQPHTVYESIQYRLEDEPFDSIADLVTCYVGSGKAVTAATGAKITTPVNRTQPLSLYSSRYGSSSSNAAAPSNFDHAGHLYSGGNLYQSGRVSSRMADQPVRKYSTNSLPRSSVVMDVMMRRQPSEPSLLSPVPAKPSRVPSATVDASKRLGRIGDFLPVVDENPIIAPSLVQSATLPRLGRTRKAACIEPVVIDPTPLPNNNKQPQLSIESMSRQFTPLFDLDNFTTMLLPATENKPLEMKTLEAVSMVFDAHTTKSIALHLLHNDLDVLGGGVNLGLDDNSSFHYQNHYKGLGVTGIELVTLPNGQQLRDDLMERTHNLRLFVAVTILTCSTLEDRADMLSQWIEIAIECKTALGDMYGFAGLMLGLCSPHVLRLNATWNLLRQRHTDTAFVFETRLRPHAKSSEVLPHAPNTTVPDVHSAILLWQATIESFLADDSVSSINGPDFGLDLLASHMDLIRSWSLNLPVYLRNSRKALQEVQFDEVLMDVFRTEFHAKFLWGSRGASADSDQRHNKFEQVLKVFSEKCEPSSA